HQRHIGSFIRFTERAYIDCLLLPYPEDEDDLGISDALTEAALERGIKVAMYRQGESFAYGRAEITLCEEDDVGYSGHPIIALSIKAGDTEILYAGSSAYNSQAYGFCEDHADDSETVILGAHGPKQKFKPAASESESVKYLYIADSTKIPVSGFTSAKVDVLESTNNAQYRIFKIE
nr:hypothetical protein [Clostridia bacterium]